MLPKTRRKNGAPERGSRADACAWCKSNKVRRLGSYLYVVGENGNGCGKLFVTAVARATPRMLVDHSSQGRTGADQRSAVIVLDC